MAYLDDLIAARDAAAAELRSQSPPPDYSWNEYEMFLVEKIERLDKLIAAEQAAQEAEAISQTTEQISGGYT